MKNYSKKLNWILTAASLGASMVLSVQAFASDESVQSSLGEMAISRIAPAATRCAFLDYNDKVLPATSSGQGSGSTSRGSSDANH